jgi:Retroviral aspartyl protease
VETIRHRRKKIVHTQGVKGSVPYGLDQVCLLASRNCKVSATVGVSTVVANPVYDILDTGAGPNLVREDVLPEDWTRYHTTEEPSFQVVGASGRPLPQRGVLTLCVQLGQLKARSKFIVMKHLTAGCILGCQFIDRNVKSILPKKRRVPLNDGSSVAILQSTPDRDIGTDPTDQNAMRKTRTPQASTKVRVSRFGTIPARSEGFVDVQCEATGLRFLQASLRGSSLGVYMANALAEIFPNRPFLVRVVKSSEKDRKLPKGMVLGQALPHPTGIVALAGLDPKPLANHPPKGLQVALYPEEYVTRFDPPPLPDRPDVEGALLESDVDFAHLTPQERDKVLGMLTNHRTMWDGRLGKFHSTAHSIQLNPGSKPAY